MLVDVNDIVLRMYDECHPILLPVDRSMGAFAQPPASVCCVSYNVAKKGRSRAVLTDGTKVASVWCSESCGLPHPHVHLTPMPIRHGELV
jgi:hypothetical protein